MSEPIDKTPRGVTNLRIKFRSASLGEFIERYAVDVSRGGIFIRTREPLSVGSRLRLDFQLLDAAPLLEGEGTVVWIRQPDAARAEVTPGMGVRFDKLSDDSQQRLDKILAEKDRLGQTGKAPGMTKSGAGIAVRRPTGAFAPLDTSPAKAPPSVEVKAGPAEIKPGAAVEAPRPSGAFSTLGRPTAGFGRPRSTTGGLSPLRSAPAPSSLFEPPTADDIDKALSVLEEKPGPVPAMPAPPRLAPASPVPVSDDASNEPTRVVNDLSELGVHEAVTGTGASVVPESGAPDRPVSLADDRTARADLEPDLEDEDVDAAELHRAKTKAASPAAFAASEASPPDAPLPGHLGAGSAASAAETSGAPTSPMPGGATGPLRKKAIIVEGASPMESGRFRTDATYRRPRTAAKRVAVLAVLAAAAGAGFVYRARLGALFPAHEVATAPATAPSPGPKPALAVDGAAADGALAAAAAAPAHAPPAEAKPPAGGPALPAPKEEKPPALPAKAAAEVKPAPAEEPRPKRRRRAPQGAAAATAQAEATPAGSPPADGDKKPAAEGGEAAAPAPSPAGASAEAPPAAPAVPVLRIVSTPSGAEVLIDGASVGKTPLAIQGVDPSATHALTLKKDGYEPAERSVATVDWSQGKAGATAKVTVKLKKSAGEAPKDEAKKDNKPDVEIITPD